LQEVPPNPAVVTPGGQVRQLDAPSTEYCPTAQRIHPVELDWLEKDPAEHFVQFGVPGLSLASPIPRDVFFVQLGSILEKERRVVSLVLPVLLRQD